MIFSELCGLGNDLLSFVAVPFFLFGLARTWILFAFFLVKIFVYKVPIKVS